MNWIPGRVSGPDRNRVWYLNWLIKKRDESMVAARAKPKKANWLKFCRDCGVDISTTARYQKRCVKCRYLKSATTARYQRRCVKYRERTSR